METAPLTQTAPKHDSAVPIRDRKWRNRVPPIVTVVGIFVVWQLVSVLAGTTALSGQRMVPSVLDVVGAFKSLSNYWTGGLGVPSTGSGYPETYAGAVLALCENTLVTLGRVSLGLLLGIGTALGAAFLVGWSAIARRLFRLPAHSARMIPLLAVMPLFSLWFGNTDTGSVLFVAVAVFPIIFVVAENSLGGVPASYSHYAQALGAGRLRTYFLVVIPAAVPGMRGGVMLALGQSWSMVIASEFLGQTLGLGNIVNQSEQFGHTDIIALIGLHVLICAGITFALTGWVFGRIVDWNE